MKKIVVIFGSIAIMVIIVMNVGLSIKKDKGLSDLSLKNMEALATVTISGMEFMTPQELSNAMNAYTGLLFQHYWVPCAIDFQATVTKSGAGLSVGTIINSLGVAVDVLSDSGTLTISSAQWGGAAYCVKGWQLFCDEISCQF